ncbi:MAG: SRPBCC domain-containing protein [Pseudomonadota bacterium]
MFQSDSDRICWKVHFASSPESVFDALATDAGRASFWAESAPEKNGRVTFHFTDHPPVVGQIVAKTRPTQFVIKYFGAVVEFSLLDDGSGGTDLTLISTGVPADERVEVIAGWASVLLAMKAAVDHGVDLRNHDASRSWQQGYVDN